MAPKKISGYNVLSSMGETPFGEILLAEDPRGERRVTIQLFAPASSSDRERFLRDLRKIGSLQARSIAPIYDFGTEGDRVYVVTDFVPGVTLADWMQKRHSLQEQVKVLSGILEALAPCHKEGILHGDVDPVNIQVMPDGECLVKNFGSGDIPATVSPSPYRAPELASGGSPTLKADVFSTGVVLYQVLAGKHPYDGAVSTALLGAQAAPPLGDLRPDVARDLTDAITGCIERDPDWRPGDLSYLTEVVRRLRGPVASAPAPKAAAKAPARAGAPAPAPKLQRAAMPSLAAGQKKGRSQLPVIVGVVAIIGALSAAGWYWYGGFASPSSPPQTRPTAVPSGPPAQASTPATEPAASPAQSPPGASAAPATQPGQASPTPAPLTLPTPHPTPPPTPTPSATPRAGIPPPAPATQAPTPTPLPATPAPTPTPPPTPPPATPPPTAPKAPAGAATLKTVSPLSLKLGSQGMLDIRGIGFASEHRVLVVRIKAEPNDIMVVNQMLKGPELILAAIRVGPSATPGAYGIVVVDSEGTPSNSLRFDVTK
jgi:serine/threonine protein kinase